MSLEDDLGAGLPGESPPISRHTKRVAKLLEIAGVLGRWRQRCRESESEREIRLKEKAAFQKKREKYALKRFKEGDTFPPKPGDGWTCGFHLWMWPSGETRRIRGWWPPHLSDENEPAAGPIIPFSSRRELSLGDCYLALAIVHDAERRGPIKILSDTGAFPSYDRMVSMVSGLDENDRLTLDDCLAKVEYDIDNLKRKDKRTRSPKQKKRSLNTTEKKILKICRQKPFKGEEISRRLELSYDHIRRVLGRLVKEHRLRNGEEWYTVVR